jgi:hypothetical protein
VDDIGLQMVNPSLDLCQGFTGPNHIEARPDHVKAGDSTYPRREDIDLVTALR